MKKIAIVTGGSSGIGKAAALMLCENGYTVYELSRRGENYSSIFHITADVTNPASIAAAAAKVIEKEGRIDLLVNNAGFGISGPVEFTDSADAHAQLEVNFYGAFNCIQAVLGKEQEPGVVMEEKSGYNGEKNRKNKTEE